VRRSPVVKVTHPASYLTGAGIVNAAADRRIRRVKIRFADEASSAGNAGAHGLIYRKYLARAIPRYRYMWGIYSK
jgi:hypothetical protein